VALHPTRSSCNERFWKLTVLSRFTARSDCTENTRFRSRLRQGTKTVPPPPRRYLKMPVELGHITPAQKLIRLLHGSTSGQPQLLWQPPLPGAEAAFAAAPRLRRIRRNHLHSQLLQRPSHLGSTLVVHLAPHFRRQPEMAAPIAVQRAEHALALDHFFQPRHH